MFFRRHVTRDLSAYHHGELTREERIRTEDHLKAIVDSLAAKPYDSLSADEKKLRDLYDTYVDRKAIDAAGLAPAKKDLDFIAGLKTLDDVGATIDLVEASGMPMGKLGRHTNDGMASFYIVSPSGFNVEYGFGGLLIDDEANPNIRHYNATSIWGHQRPVAAVR